jgi:hypothetical protein
MEQRSQSNGKRGLGIFERGDFHRRASGMPGIRQNGRRGSALALCSIFAALFLAASCGNAGEILRLNFDDGIIAQGAKLTGAAEADVIAVGKGYKKNGLQLKPGSKLIIPVNFNPKEGTVAFKIKSAWEKTTPGNFSFFAGAYVDFYRLSINRSTAKSIRRECYREPSMS